MRFNKCSACCGSLIFDLSLRTDQFGVIFSICLLQCVFQLCISLSLFCFSASKRSSSVRYSCPNLCNNTHIILDLILYVLYNGGVVCTFTAASLSSTMTRCLTVHLAVVMGAVAVVTVDRGKWGMPFQVLGHTDNNRSEKW